MHGWTRLHGLLRVVELRAALPKSLLPLRNDESGREAALMLSSERERVRIVSEKAKSYVSRATLFWWAPILDTVPDARCFRTHAASRMSIPPTVGHTYPPASCTRMAPFSSFRQLRHDEHAAAARSTDETASFSSSLPQLNPASLKARNEAMWPTCSCSCGSAAAAAAAAAHPQAIALGLWPPERKPVERPHPHSIRPALVNPAVSIGLDEHFSDWRPQEVAASALHELCGSMHQQLQNQRHTAEEAASRHRTYLSLMAQKHKRLSAEASHAREGEARAAELERALNASLKREDESLLREAELARRLAREVEKAERVEPLLRRLEEAKAALSGAQLAAPNPNLKPTLALALALALTPSPNPSPSPNPNPKPNQARS